MALRQSRFPIEMTFYAYRAQDDESDNEASCWIVATYVREVLV
jgi:hypothetical protein